VNIVIGSNRFIFETFVGLLHVVVIRCYCGSRSGKWINVALTVVIDFFMNICYL